MEIEVSKELGLCFGVKRAAKLLEETASKYGGIEILGLVAHNRQLVERLIEVGVKPVKNLDQVQGKILAIATHGTGPSVLSAVKARHIHIIDTTCPIVRKAQNTAKGLADAEFDVIIFGETEHSEVQGLLGWTKGKGIATLDVKQIDVLVKKPYRLGIISQTTQLQSALTEFTEQLINAFAPKAKEIRFVNTLCRTVQRRQETAIRLAGRSQIMIVIGGHNSANTNRLAQLCSRVTRTYLIETAAEIDPSWFKGQYRVGITAGTSAAEETINDVVVRLESIA